MPRKARIDAPGALHHIICLGIERKRIFRLDAPSVLHHIMIRGIERQKIFRDNKDRENLLERLVKLLPETQTACYAWVFITHAHFLFRTGKVPLATLRLVIKGWQIMLSIVTNKNK